jgi:hypothetical protein
MFEITQDLEPSRVRRGGSPGVTLVFAAAAFLGAFLLFVVQPLVARLVLPSYGGSPSVWSTSSFFFQVLLLLGYLYSHWTTTRLGRSRQPWVHLVVLLGPLVVLPVALPSDAAPTDHSPVLWLLRTLVLMIGLPFVVVSTTGPLLQKWYSWTSAHRSEDPYFLFAASNLGSFGGLLAYPVLIETTMSLDQQRLAWSLGFGVFAVLTASCGLVAARSNRFPARTHDEALSIAGLSRRQILAWLALSFLPSALMLAVTSHITTDIAAIPLLWVIPLAIYLATFVVAFARQSREIPVTATRMAVGLGFAASLGGALPGGNVMLQVGLQLLMLALVGYAAHARLAAGRPDPAHLTTFYLVVAVGGALGGLLNGLIAPTLFDRVLEYPLVMIAIPLLMFGVRTPGLADEHRAAWKSAALVLVGAVALASAVGAFTGRPGLWVLAFPCLVLLAVTLGLRLSREPALLITALIVVFGAILMADQLRAIDQRRTFFGSHQVRETDDMHLLLHGTTLHGSQFLDERSSVPTTYYTPSGPLGAVFRRGDFQAIGAIGLGAGTVAAYGKPGMSLTFFEIDGAVADIATTPKFFTYISDSRADVDIVLGDGRLEIAEQPKGSFDLIILDAFSSDAVPVHLLTVEAMRTYGERLRPGGVIAVNVSNKVFDLGDVIAGSAAKLGWYGAQDEGGDRADGGSLSRWVVVSPSTELVDTLKEQEGWDELDTDRVLWTDDHSSILSALP